MTAQKRLSPEEVAGPEWAAWWAMTPVERLEASHRQMTEYLALGGSLDPEVDTQSPFWSEEDLKEFAQRQQGRIRDARYAKTRDARTP